MPSISGGRYRQSVSITHPRSRVIVFSDVDGVLRAPNTPAFTTAAAALRQLAFDDTALVLCSGRTRAELEFVQQKLDITHPFICENGGALMIPHGYFGFELPNSHNVAGCQAVEFGRAYTDVVDILHRTAARLRIEILGFSGMSIEEVAKEWQLPLLQARLAKLREYEEPFRLIDPDPAARSRLFKALGAAGLHCRTGGRFERVGAHLDSAAAVNLLNSLYRRGRSDLITLGITRTTPDDSLFKLVDYAIMAADDDPLAGRSAAGAEAAGEESITVVDWAEAIVDRVKELRRKRAMGSAAATGHIR
jgi:mannosyl-3-phosphoglycerate phosphatase